MFKSFDEFKRGKRGKSEVAEFEIESEDSILKLYNQLLKGQYRHSPYFQFKIADPKPRIIHKANVRDRVLHQAIFRQIGPIFEKSFIFDSYSSRLKKGTHKSVGRLEKFTKKISLNYKNSVYSVKIDIKKFFDTVDHQILFRFLKEKIKCPKTLSLLKLVIESYETKSDKGIPLGNVMSQLFANIYLNPLDKFIKEKLRLKHYLRFCDDMILVKENSKFERELSAIQKFIQNNLKLNLKIGKIRKLKWGFDWLGYVVLPHHRVLRTRTKRRMLRNLKNGYELMVAGKITPLEHQQVLNSYRGLLKHCDSFKLKRKLDFYYRFTS